MQTWITTMVFKEKVLHTFLPKIGENSDHNIDDLLPLGRSLVLSSFYVFWPFFGALFSRNKQLVTLAQGSPAARPRSMSATPTVAISALTCFNIDRLLRLLQKGYRRREAGGVAGGLPDGTYISRPKIPNLGKI
jgi:hypothetical protein